MNASDNQQRMPLYQGTKVLHATPMTRGAYNGYRGWLPPEGEDQTTAGYLVEYVDGGQPNDERHKGYISWSPKDVFEGHYKPIDTHVDRIRVEIGELGERYDKLDAFIQTDPRFSGLSTVERGLLKAQQSAMGAYLEVLYLRLGIAEGIANG